MARRGPEPGSPKARNGGLSIKAKYGSEFYSRIGKKGGETLRDNGKDYAEMGRAGGNVTKERHGSEYFQRIGQLGGRAGKGTAKSRRQGKAA